MFSIGRANKNSALDILSQCGPPKQYETQFLLLDSLNQLYTRRALVSSEVVVHNAPQRLVMEIVEPVMFWLCLHLPNFLLRVRDVTAM